MQPEKSLKQRAMSSAIWNIGGFGAQNLIRLMANLVLTRLLVPEMFGLMAIVQVFTMGLHLFSDIGLGLNIIQNKKGEEPEFFNTAWTIQTIRGTGLWVVSFLIAGPAAAFYDNPELCWLIPVVGSNAFITGFQSTSFFVLNKRVLFDKIIKLGIAVQVLSVTVMITWAFFEQTIVAIVAGSIIGSIARTVASHFLLEGHHNKFTWNKEASREIFSFGKWIFVSTAILFLAGQADRMILGKLFTLKQLGIYAIALNFSEIPKNLIRQLGSKVIFPVVSNLVDLPRPELRSKIIKKRWWLLGGCAAVVSLLACFGDLLILKLYDERYRDAAVMLPILALGIWPFILHSSIDPSLLAVGKPKVKALGNVFKFIFMVVCTPLFFSWQGVVGAIIAIALNDLPTLCTVQYGLRREGLSAIRQDILATIGCCTAIAIIIWLRHIFGYPISFRLMEG